ncbi:Subtilisin-like protease SBT1.2 [Arabidopsis thaliana]|jgi:subtilisin family serine protease|uniref:Subtilisin-like protease SBT1.2 n=4 Tax=Arabidopsis TaxID=3701 RepID=SBT12_ARATH|nr:Subtilase family protein [Arabidopsis thaliana]O64495.1 RecName: Full=Subtilisin-like protease SBT1.2; AltName: Full=Cucumisin-like serine protease SDD1; AltName: Full=Protein STOMATAL DENSITY AND DISTRIBUTION 1; AltName: Full=Subtilase subfamily 1 member 2; Short=AtSBT1.2; AltName: Full=Subtilisin-like protease SDD1; Flags: Precursor [Arabidopsis thaliana]KAG7595763.1 PA domain [Arabidopsis suecica]KAG7645015.1 PA domain [Arabidopsis thaliana x Arabidopsis arenosa]AAC16749.1 Strong similari|eukprot:NP_563701.1 Subtilase family protein [Arabidopsis thaliana]
MEPKPFFLCIIFLLFCSSSSEILQKQTYIVQLHPNSETAKTFASKFDWHLSFLQEAVLGVEEEEEEPSSRLLYSYGSAIEGFAAQLTESEAEILRYSPEVVAVRPDHVLQVQTTYSYKFLGLDGFGNSGVWSKSRFGQGTIIGVLDTGVWPESPSFDDTGMPSIPRKWKGICQEGESFSSSSCNRKLIGARFFIRGHRVANSPEESPNMPREYISARDSTGHGTHTASTVGGSSVSMANVLGNGAGVARGMAPGAHIAVYKVCWFNGCYSSDILAAIDVAIQDKVDVLSLSLGGFPIPLYDDTIAIGTFRAMERGISVICAAGNNGPIESSVANTAPWVSTIGAGTLDRRFPAVVRLANGKLLYGESLYPGKGIKNAGREVEVIYVTGGDKGSEFCLRGSLPREEIRGKMVICDRGVNGRSEKGEAVKEAGGVAMILANTEINQEEDSIDVHLLPATLIGYTESVLLKAYVNATVKPKARIIFGGTVIGRSRAPEVAQFSARGPSLANPSILKPDMIAPGVNIIAAWPQNLGPTGLPYDSRRVNFTVMSGTSMSCPHVSGITALIRSAYPNWSPAAIKSALMTTADLYDRQGKAIKDGNKPAGVFAIGAGHVNPQKAINPGLVYNIQPVDYITYLCTLGFTRSDILAITHKNVSCNGILRKNPGFSLNYPSIAVIFKRGKTTEMITRRVTNVGSPNSIYSVNVKAPEGIKVIVNPKRLVFKHVDQTLSYRVWFVLKKKNRGGKVASFAQGQLTWVNSHNLMQRVRSPISVTLKTN